MKQKKRNNGLSFIQLNEADQKIILNNPVYGRLIKSDSKNLLRFKKTINNDFYITHFLEITFTK